MGLIRFYLLAVAAGLVLSGIVIVGHIKNNNLITPEGFASYEIYCDFYREQEAKDWECYLF